MTVLHCILHALDLAWHALLWSWAVIGAAILLASIVGLIHDWREQRAERAIAVAAEEQPIDPWPDDLIARLQRVVADEIASQKRSMS